MLYTLSPLSDNAIIALVWIALCAQVALVTVSVLVTLRIRDALTRRAILNARVAAVMGGRI